MTTRNRTRTVLALAAVAMATLALTATSANAQVTTITGTDGGHDSWNVDTNWDAGIASGAVEAVVAAGVTAQCWNATTPTYDGPLTLLDNSTLQMGWTTNYPESLNALGNSSVTMNAGSSIRLRLPFNLNLPPITLMGNGASVHQSPSTSAHHRTRNFDAVSGAYDFTIIGNNNNTANLNQANTFTSLIANADDRWHLRGKVAGSLGLGDVTVNPRSGGKSASLYIDAADAMADTAKLSLNGLGYGGIGEDRLVMNANDTVNELWIDGTQAPAGTYDVSQTWIKTGSTGTLTVTTGAVVGAPTIAPSDFVDDVFEGPIYEDFTEVNYTLTFSNDMDLSTFAAIDFGNAGTVPINIGTITKTYTPSLPNAPSVFNVPVLLPSSAGSLQFQINSGAGLTDVLGNPLDTTSAIPDDTTITINAGPTPPTTISGTAGGNNSWNEAANWDNGIPWGGPRSAIVAAGVLATVYDNSTPTYGGGLTLEAGATLRMGGGSSQNVRNSINAIGTGPITMKAGSEINLQMKGATVEFPAITLEGNATIASVSNDSHHTTRDFNGVISGPGQLTLQGVNNNTLNLNATNTFDGLVVESPSNQDFRVFATATGSLGSGDVSIPNKVSLIIDALDAIADDATLTLTGSKSNKPNAANPGFKLVLNFDDTIADFWLDGLQIAPGTYDSTSGLFDIDLLPLIGGSGALTVTPFVNLYTWDGGAFDWNSPHWNTGQSPGANGDMVIDVASSVVTVDADFTTAVGGGPAGSVAVGETNTASLIVDNGSTLEVTGDVAVGNSGTLQVDGRLEAAMVTSHGTLSGGGTIVGEVWADGIVAPGSDSAKGGIGTLTFDTGDPTEKWVEFGPAAEVNMDIGVTNDVIVMQKGKLDLGGSQLNLNVVGDILPAAAKRSYGAKTVRIVDTTEDSEIDDVFNTALLPGDHLDRGIFVDVEGNGVVTTTISVKVDLYQAQKGDTNGDHVIDTGDMMLVFGNWSLLPPPDNVPRDWPEGNFSFFPPEDANTTIETGDMMEVFGNWTLEDAGDAKDGDPQIADLLYYPATGDVQLDPSEAAGEVITIFRLMNEAGEPDFNAPGEANFPWPIPDFLAVDTPLEIANTDLSGSGISDVWSLGAIFPTGLDQDQLEAFLTVATYVGSRGTGVHRLDLIVIPEPGTVVMLLGVVGGLLLLAIRRRRRA